MGIDSLLFIFSVIDEGALLFLVVYFVITLSDLECDYLNATSCCSKLNRWVLPEMIAQSVLAFFLLVTGHWILFLMYTPVTAWMVYKMIISLLTNEATGAFGSQAAELANLPDVQDAQEVMDLLDG